jgi:NRAMP (natural resistance-associated macrophage protein)-like metal ion transporter
MRKQEQSDSANVLQDIGPGVITGASDDDPSGIATYATTGARFSYGHLWSLLYATPFMIAVQEMCGRIGLVRGRGLGSAIRARYGKKMLAFAALLLLIANTINIGADLGAMASTLGLLIKLPFLVSLGFIVALTLYLEITVPYKRYAVYLKYLALTLLVYIVTLAMIKIDWSAVLSGVFIPRVMGGTSGIANIVAILGTTISPYLFFWQSNEEVEELHASHERGNGWHPIHLMRKDTVRGMLFSNVIGIAIMLAAAGTLGVFGVSEISDASELATLIRPLAGNAAFFLVALGILGTGLLAIPILAGSSAYALAELFDWHEGLEKKPRRAPAFYAVIAISTLAGLLLASTGLKPFTMLYLAAMVNGIVAPPLLFMIVGIASSRRMMGPYVNSTLSNVLGYGTAILMALAVILLVV